MVVQKTQGIDGSIVCHHTFPIGEGKIHTVTMDYHSDSEILAVGGFSGRSPTGKVPSEENVLSVQLWKITEEEPYYWKMKVLLLTPPNASPFFNRC